MRNILYILLFTCLMGNAQVVDRFTRFQSTSSLLAPPLDSNSNPELITGNAAAFGTDEVNGTSGITAIGTATVTSELVDDGYEGDYVAKVAAGGTSGYDRCEHQGITISSSTTYEYALLYKHNGSGATGRFRIYDGSSNIVDTSGLGATTWTLITGTFTTGASATYFDAEIWPQRPFVGPDGTEEIEYKLSVKLQ